MAPLHVHLQEGFTGRPVCVSVNGTQVYSGTPKTRLQIGLAHQVECEVPDSAGAVAEIELASGEVRETIRVDASLTPYVGLSLDRDGKVKARMSAEPFGYL